MKPLLVILCLNMGFCSSLGEQWRIETALADHYEQQAYFKRLYRAEIKQVTSLMKP